MFQSQIIHNSDQMSWIELRSGDTKPTRCCPHTVQPFICAVLVFLIFAVYVLSHNSHVDTLSKITICGNQSVNSREKLAVHEGNKTQYNIGILVVLDKRGDEDAYRVAHDSLICYAKLQNYTLNVAYVNDNASLIRDCTQKDFMLKRHCIAAQYISKYDWTLFVDGDIGIINPHHRIEEYIDESVSVIFYDRFFVWETMTGTYLVKNSNYSVWFLNAWANFDFRLPKSFHGTDNGLIHILFMEQFAPSAVKERLFCEQLLNKSKDWAGVFRYEACARLVLGAERNWPGKIKILKRGEAWARDSWITDTKYCERDFMLHGWKQKVLGGEWKMPFEKAQDLAKCDTGFEAFATNDNFSISVQEVDVILKKLYVEVEKGFLKQVGSLADDMD